MEDPINAAFIPLPTSTKMLAKAALSLMVCSFVVKALSTIQDPKQRQVTGTKSTDNNRGGMAYSASSRAKRPGIAALQRTITNSNNRPRSLQPYIVKISAVLVVTAIYTAYIYQSGTSYTTGLDPY
jgi:hypothetical protein